MSASTHFFDVFNEMVERLTYRTPHRWNSRMTLHWCTVEKMEEEDQLQNWTRNQSRLTGATPLFLPRRS